MKHEWKAHQQPDTPDAPAEWFAYCEACGAEANDDNEDGDCPADVSLTPEDADQWAGKDVVCHVCKTTWKLATPINDLAFACPQCFSDVRRNAAP